MRLNPEMVEKNIRLLQQVGRTVDVVAARAIGREPRRDRATIRHRERCRGVVPNPDLGCTLGEVTGRPQGDDNPRVIAGFLLRGRRRPLAVELGDRVPATGSRVPATAGPRARSPADGPRRPGPGDGRPSGAGDRRPETGKPRPAVVQAVAASE